MLVSEDPVERDLAKALLRWQEQKGAAGRRRSLGYEPRDIRQKGAAKIIEARVRSGASGYNDVDEEWSYEAIVARYPDRFSDDVVEIANRRLQDQPGVTPDITAEDVDLIAASRAKKRYAELSEQEHAAYGRVSRALQAMGHLLKSRLTNSERFDVRLTSGFNVKSGVRGSIPKDLWFSVSPAGNSKSLAGMPQLFMIVSERGVEYGFGASVSPNDFSQPSVKEMVRRAAPLVFDRLPKPGSTEAKTCEDALNETGNWYFRRKHRLPPNQNEFGSLNEWLIYLRSDEGKRAAAGAISRYVQLDNIDAVHFDREIGEMARLFECLIDRDWLSADNQAVETTQQVAETLENMEGRMDFAERLKAFLTCYSEKRDGLFKIDNELKSAMESLEKWLQELPAVANRPSIKVKMSVGQGGWTKTPWIALLDNRETTTTQRGTYIVFLIAEDLSVTYLTLNQGMTDLRSTLGQRGAVEAMLNVASEIRPQIQELSDAGFQLDNQITLFSETGAAKNYEIGTIAHVDYASDDLPDDATVIRQLHALLGAYARIVERSPATPAVMPDPDAGDWSDPVAPYGIEDALRDLFLEEKDVQRYLDIWSHKKNMILQGAPGVGKSFIARRLAYTLIGALDDQKIQTVQFHQTYSYEDFVQGYRPNGQQGFDRKNGIFYQFCERALDDPDSTYVFIIDEINRGNLSKIFGELMLLVEADKRGPTWRTRLTYALDTDPDFFVPNNLYILGMMNTADRSLSLVDYALRRRFAFVAMEPQYHSLKFTARLEETGVSVEVINKIIRNMAQLNEDIANDRINLGPGFRIGHSFFTPTKYVSDPNIWYNRVVETEIYPLLEEYWFDAPETASQWLSRLLD